jgi:hypothetical protein
MEGTLRDEIDGAIQKLCSIACQSERDIKVARDTLRRIATRTRDGAPQADYAPLVERVMARLMGERKGDDWFMKHRLLETIPTFVNRGEKFVIVGCAAMLKHDNWMIRAAATEALGHLMTRDDVSLPHCASRPGTRTNSRPASPGSSALRPPNVSEKQRAQHGLVIDENYGQCPPVCGQKTNDCAFSPCISSQLGTRTPGSSWLPPAPSELTSRVFSRRHRPRQNAVGREERARRAREDPSHHCVR